MSICKAIQNTAWGGNFSLYFSPEIPRPQRQPAPALHLQQSHELMRRQPGDWPNFTTPRECGVRPRNSDRNNGWRGPPVFYPDIFIRKPEVESTARVTIRISILLKCYVP